MHDRVILTGRRSDIPELLRSADLFVFPSESEGLPNSIIEACLARLPIVACDVPGVTDVVENGRHAVLVPPRAPTELAAAIQRLLDDPSESARLATTAYEMAIDRFSIAGFMERIHRVYDDLLEPAPRKTGTGSEPARARSASVRAARCLSPF